MIYIRGNPLDYDHWRDLGNPAGDSPTFFRTSRNRKTKSVVLRTFTASDGPFTCRRSTLRESADARFPGRGSEVGIPSNPDFNGAAQEGAGLYQLTQKNGARCSAVDGYLKPALGRPNLTVLTGAHVARVSIENGRASGVDFLRDGALKRRRADAEVILAGGTVNSPQMLNAIGCRPRR